MSLKYTHFSMDRVSKESPSGDNGEFIVSNKRPLIDQVISVEKQRENLRDKIRLKITELFKGMDDWERQQNLEWKLPNKTKYSESDNYWYYYSFKEGEEEKLLRVSIKEGSLREEVGEGSFTSDKMTCFNVEEAKPAFNWDSSSYDGSIGIRSQFIKFWKMGDFGMGAIECVNDFGDAGIGFSNWPGLIIVGIFPFHWLRDSSQPSFIREGDNNNTDPVREAERIIAILNSSDTKLVGRLNKFKIGNKYEKGSKFSSIEDQSFKK
jgi:hypothetical protein